MRRTSASIIAEAILLLYTACTIAGTAITVVKTAMIHWLNETDANHFRQAWPTARIAITRAKRL